MIMSLYIVCESCRIKAVIAIVLGSDEGRVFYARIHVIVLLKGDERSL
jgi:hypothetical protein